MAVAYHTHLFEIPTATDAEAQAGVITDKVVVPAGLAAALASYVTSTALTTTLADYALSASLGTAAVEDVGYFATAAQGALADSALQAADIGSTVQAYSANLDEFAAVNPTAAGLALLDDADAAAQRTTLGLGTSAMKNTGTSGDAVPLLNGANTWSGAQTITTTAAGSTILKLESTDAGATGGPQLDFDRASATPAVNDVLGVMRALGRDSGGNTTTYGSVEWTALDPTDGSEDGQAAIKVPVAGAQTTALSIANGVIVGAPTGSYQGTGTVNATDYYLNGSALSSSLFGVTPGTTGLALLDDTSASAARTTLELGTSAVKNTGTSGDAVPLLNAANTWSAPQAIASSTADLRLDKTASGDLGRILGYTAGSLRWIIEMSDAVAESGSNAGSNFNIKSRTDAGGALTTPISIARATGIVVMAHGATVGDTSGDPVVIKGTTVDSFSSGLLDNANAAAWRTDLGLGSAAVLTAGDASGNLKVLNVDGALTFATTATSTNVAGVNAGVWKTAHRFDSTDTATYSGNRTTMAILRGYTGSGENGPTRSDTALHLEAEQDNWLTTSVLGESDTLRVFNRKGVNGDMAGMLINVSKVESASYGSLAWEAASNWVQATTGTTLRLMRTNSGHQGPSTDLRGGGVGFNATAMTGNHNIAFAAFEDYTDTGQWKYPFLGADGYLNGDEYFYVTGPAHASGKGKLYTSGIAHIAATVAAPAGGGATGMIAIGNLATFGIYFGTGAPTVSAAKGSLYLRRDGTTTNNRSYINTDGGTTWTALTTAA